MPPELQPDVWPWEWLWFLTLAVAGATALSLAVRIIRRRGLGGRQPWLRWGTLAVAVVLAIMPFLIYDDWLDQLTRTQNVSETSIQASDPDLRTRVFALPPESVFAAAVSVVRETPTWRLTRQDADAGLISAEVSVALGLLTNDVLIQVAGVAPGGAQVDVRASARRPAGDLGTTEREITLFYRRLEQTLTTATQ